jgi:hypothetical protein
MRYRLRTLVIATIIGPPLLGLAWYLAIWARFAISPTLEGITRPFFPLGMLAVIVLILYTVAAPPPEDNPAIALLPWQLFLFWLAQFLAQWHWILILVALGGWLFVWGDRGPPFSERAMITGAGIAAATVASVASTRVWLGHATKTYVITIVCFVTPMLTFAGLFWLGRLLR